MPLPFQRAKPQIQYLEVGGKKVTVIKSELIFPKQAKLRDVQNYLLSNGIEVEIDKNKIFVVVRIEK